MEDKITSFTAASELPLKIFLDNELVNSIKKGVILPRHIQLNPENNTNLNCDWCSCSKRDKNLELDYNGLISTMRGAYKLGCKAVTITGAI